MFPFLTNGNNKTTKLDKWSLKTNHCEDDQ